MCVCVRACVCVCVVCEPNFKEGKRVSSRMVSSVPSLDIYSTSASTSAPISLDDHTHFTSRWESHRTDDPLLTSEKKKEGMFHFYLRGTLRNETM